MTPHIHRAAEEACFVLEGELAVYEGDSRVDQPPGPAPEALAAVHERFGLEVVGPPPL